MRFKGICAGALPRMRRDFLANSHFLPSEQFCFEWFSIYSHGYNKFGNSNILLSFLEVIHVDCSRISVKCDLVSELK
jgi:hypothetical protein